MIELPDEFIQYLTTYINDEIFDPAYAIDNETIIYAIEAYNGGAR